MSRKKFPIHLFFLTFICIISIVYFNKTVFAQDGITIPSLTLGLESTDEPTEVVSTLQLLFLISIISLAPSLLIMFTSFTRIIISLHFLRSALGTQQMPPNQVLIGLALFLTLFLMSGVFSEINEKSLQPYTRGEISQEQALTEGMQPIRKFMISQVEGRDIALFTQIAGETYENKEDVPSRVLIPAFLLGEITKGFKFGFIIYLPFIVIDMVVASTLMAMGMMMLPPAMISMPFKILLFIMADGWNLVIQNLVISFYNK